MSSPSAPESKEAIEADDDTSSSIAADDTHRTTDAAAASTAAASDAGLSPHPADDPSWLHHLLRSLLTLGSFGPPHYALLHSASLARQAHRARQAALVAEQWRLVRQRHPGPSAAAAIRRRIMMDQLSAGGAGGEAQAYAAAAAMEPQGDSLPWRPHAEANDAFAAASTAAAAAAAAASASAASASVAASSEAATAAPAASSAESSSSSAAVPIAAGQELLDPSSAPPLVAADAADDALSPSPPSLGPQQLDHAHASASSSDGSNLQHQPQSSHRHHHHHGRNHRSSSPVGGSVHPAAAAAIAAARRRHRRRSRFCDACAIRGEELGHRDPHSRHFAPSLLLPSTSGEMLHWLGHWVAAPLALMACQMLGGLLAERAWEALAVRAAGGRPQPLQPKDILATATESMTPARAQRIAEQL